MKAPSENHYKDSRAQQSNELLYVGCSGVTEVSDSSSAVPTNLEQEPLFEGIPRSPGMFQASFSRHRPHDFMTNTAVAQHFQITGDSSVPQVVVQKPFEGNAANIDMSMDLYATSKIVLDGPPFSGIAEAQSPFFQWPAPSMAIEQSPTPSETSSYISMSSFPGAPTMSRLHSNSSLSSMGDFPNLDSLSPSTQMSNSPSLPYSAPMHHDRLPIQPYSSRQSLSHRTSVSSQHSQASLLSPHSPVARPSSPQPLKGLKPGYHRRQAPASQRRRQSKHSLPDRTIRPKATQIIEDTDVPGMVRIKSSDGTSRRAGVLPRQIRSVSSAPTTADPLLCKVKDCQRYPKGFRGEHELQRHMSLYHMAKKKVWVCVAPANDPEFLNKCKRCMKKQQYGADYNAASHLRRMHFNPRKRGRKAKNSTESRAGKGGGSDPPMAHLKATYMIEIEVDNDEYAGKDENDDEDDQDLATEEIEHITGQVDGVQMHEDMAPLSPYYPGIPSFASASAWPTNYDANWGSASSQMDLGGSGTFLPPHSDFNQFQ